MLARVRPARPLIALAVALAIGGWLLASRPASQPASQPVPSTEPTTLQTVSQQPHTTAARLSDGAIYTPMLYVDADTAVGTAPTPDGSAERLVLRTPGGERGLRRIEQSRFPQFLGFTPPHGGLYRAAPAATPRRPDETPRWRARVSPRPGPAR